MYNTCSGMYLCVLGGCSGTIWHLFGGGREGDTGVSKSYSLARQTQKIAFLPHFTHFFPTAYGEFVDNQNAQGSWAKGTKWESEDVQENERKDRAIGCYMWKLVPNVNGRGTSREARWPAFLERYLLYFIMFISHTLAFTFTSRRISKGATDKLSA